MSRLIRRLFDHAARTIHPRRRRLRTAAALKARLLLSPLEDRAVPATFTVNALTDTGTGSGTSGDLRYCINQSNAMTGPNTISLTGVTGTITLASALPGINQPTTLIGPGASALTIDANSVAGVFVVSTSSFEMDNLTITHGKTLGNGGGISSSTSGVSITVKNSVISGNTALGPSYGGGAIYIGFGGSLNVQNSSIVNNSTAANGGGGGIYFWGTVGSYTISNSTIANNTAHNGGGLWLNNFSGTANIIGTTISGNTATNATAGAGYGGGGVNLRTTAGTVNLDNTIVSGNSSANGNNEFAVFGTVAAKYSALGSTAAIGTYTNNGGNLVGAALNLQPLNNVAGPNGIFPVVGLGGGSAAVNVGDPALGGGGQTDEIGTPRPQGAGVDIGAVERVAGIPTVSAPAGGFANVTAAVAAPAVYTFAVTYTDDAAILYSSVNNNGNAVTVTTPAGVAPVTVAFVGATPTGNAASITATYQFSAPGGAWDPTDNGTYSVNMAANQVKNTNNVYVPGSPPAIGTFTVNVPPPTATAVTHTVASPAEPATYQFTVTYSDSAPIDYSTVNGNNNAVTVTGNLAAGGTVNPAVSFVSATPNGNAATITATYQFTAPGGSWDSTDNGPYTVSMAANQVKNVNGTYVPGSPPVIGSFQVEVPRTITVTNTADSGAGSLRDAVTQANADAPAVDVIAFSNTTAGGNVNFYDGATHAITLTSGELALTKSATVTGPGPNGLIVSGNNASRVFDIFGSSPLTVGISGMRLTGGSGGASGGGAVYLQAANVTLTNVVVDASTAVYGAGISLNAIGDTLTLINSTVAGNTANTTTGHGGGIDVQQVGNVALVNTTLSGNSAGSSGGGIYFNLGGSLQVTDSTISGNTAGGVRYGGGVYWWGSVNANGFTISNSTIANNQAGAFGGGIWLNNFNSSAGGVLNVTSCTITANSAGSGGGIYDTSAGIIHLDNSIIAGNTANPSYPDIYDVAPVTSTYDAIGNSTGFTYTAGTGDLPVGAALNLGALSNHGGPTPTIVPGPGSAAIDAGDPAQGGPGRTDQRGVPRPQGAGVDIGAVETATPPQVASVVVGSGAQRSEVRQVVVTFDRAVSFTGGNGNAAAAFQLQHLSYGSTVYTSAFVNNLGAAVTTDGQGRTVVTLTFTAVGNSTQEIDPASIQNGGAASLNDGKYQLTIFGANVSGSGGQLAGDGSIPGSNYVTPAYGSPGDTVRLYRLFGDATGDGVVDLSDLTAFRNTYNAGTGNPAFVPYLDSDNDGVIDLDDLTAFRNRYNHTV
jgi:hypothetical protein